MARTVYKYQLQPLGNQTVMLPKGAEVLSFNAQHDTFCIWAAVDPDAALEDRVFHLVGTGHPLDENAGKLHFVGTAIMDGGSLVFHLFERRSAWQ